MWSLKFFTKRNCTTTAGSSKFGAFLRPQHVFFCILFIFFCNFWGQKRVPEMGSKMGPSFGRTLRIVLKPDSEAQFWGTKNGPKNESQNRVKTPFFFCGQKYTNRRPKESLACSALAHGCSAQEDCRSFSWPASVRGILLFISEKLNAVRAYRHIINAGQALRKKHACV